MQKICDCVHLQTRTATYFIERIVIVFTQSCMPAILSDVFLLLLRGRPQSTPHGSLSSANPVIHRCWRAVSEDPSVRLQQINKCASLSSDAPFAMLQFPQSQIANNFIFTPPPMTAELRAPLFNCGRDPR